MLIADCWLNSVKWACQTVGHYANEAALRYLKPHSQPLLHTPLPLQPFILSTAMTSGKRARRKKKYKKKRQRTTFPMLHCKQILLSCECCSCFLTSWLCHFHTARGPIEIIRGTYLCTYAYMFKRRDLIMRRNRPKLKKNRPPYYLCHDLCDVSLTR